MASQKKQRIATRSFPITRFSGIETKYSGIDQKAGTLRVADGVNVVPLGQLSFGPNWGSAWGLSNLASLITTALSGADVTKVHFVTVTMGGIVFLIAWDLQNARPQGVWEVVGEGNPFSTATTTSTVTPIQHIHTEDITFTGGAVPRSVTISDVGRMAGDICRIDCTFPSVAGIVVSFYDNAAFTVAGTPLAVFTTDGVTLTACLEFTFNASGAWEYVQAQAPA